LRRRKSIQAPGSVLEDVLDLFEGVGRKDVGKPQLRGVSVLAGVDDVARYKTADPA
jgi:hypothetical protein